jgi:hypothetical protein
LTSSPGAPAAASSRSKGAVAGAAAAPESPFIGAVLFSLQ